MIISKSGIYSANFVFKRRSKKKKSSFRGKKYHFLLPPSTPKKQTSFSAFIFYKPSLKSIVKNCAKESKHNIIDHNYDEFSL